MAAQTIDTSELQPLIDALRADGRTVIGPMVRDGAIVYDEIRTSSELPIGWHDHQEPGTYRIERSDDRTVFSYAVGPTSLRTFLTPAERTAWVARRTDDGVRFEAAQAPPPRYAFLGVRACDLAALSARSRVPDPWAASVLDQALIIGVQCATSASTCFCASMGTGPEITTAVDLVVTEITDPDHRLVVEARTPEGETLLGRLDTSSASDEHVVAASAAVERAATQQRSLDPARARRVLGESLRHPHWDDIASRCLSCTNCTMVCPTCFCTSTTVDAPVGSDEATTVERWDSCFTNDFTHLHGVGPVRPDTKAQYRQWLTHKLVSWWDQFDTSGCVGCGRCITWCPVGIDLTDEVVAFEANS